MVTWKSESTSSRNASNSSSARSTSSISSTGARSWRDGLEQRALEQERLARRSSPPALASAVALAALLEPDVQQLLRVVPLVERRGGVEPLVALQADQVGVEHPRQHLGDLGLADARVALDQERLLERHRQVHRGRDGGIGDVLGLLHQSAGSCADLLRARALLPTRRRVRSRRACPRPAAWEVDLDPLHGSGRRCHDGPRALVAAGAEARAKMSARTPRVCRVPR